MYLFVCLIVCFKRSMCSMLVWMIWVVGQFFVEDFGEKSADLFSANG